MRWSMPVAALISLFSVTSAHSATSTPDVRADVLAFVREFTEATNRADVPALMEMYVHSPTLISVDNGTIRRGWDAVREDVNQVLGKEGSYKFSVGSFDVLPLGPGRALATGPYVANVQTPQGPVELHGALTLVLERRQGKWLILHDHSSIAIPTTE